MSEVEPTEVNPAEIPISVVIPTRHRDDLLVEAIESVLNCDLRVPPHQVIIVDDSGGSASTKEVARTYGTKYLSGPSNTGPGTARNRGLAIVETDFVAFLDDDDCWTAQNMVPQLAALQADPSLTFAFGRVQRTDAWLTPAGDAFPAGAPRDEELLEFLYTVDVQVGAALFRTAELAKIGGFRDKLLWFEDRDLLVRLSARSKGTFVDVTGCLYRQRQSFSTDSMNRWNSHQAYCRLQHDFARQGIPVGRKTRLKAEMHFRGMTSFYFCDDASQNLRRGDRAGALKSLTYALRTSPVHTLARHRTFWRCAMQLATAHVWRGSDE